MSEGSLLTQIQKLFGASDADFKNLCNTRLTTYMTVQDFLESCGSIEEAKLWLVVFKNLGKYIIGSESDGEEENDE